MKTDFIVPAIQLKIKYTFLIVAATILVSCSPYKRYIKAHELMNVDFERTYRDYVLCKCIRFGYNNPEFLKEDISTGVYEDITLHTLAFNGTQQKLDSLAKSIADSIQPSQIADHGGRKAVMLPCIEFYNSRELKLEVRKIIEANAKLWDGRPAI